MDRAHCDITINPLHKYYSLLSSKSVRSIPEMLNPIANTRIYGQLSDEYSMLISNLQKLCGSEFPQLIQKNQAQRYVDHHLQIYYNKFYQLRPYYVRNRYYIFCNLQDYSDFEFEKEIKIIQNCLKNSLTKIKVQILERWDSLQKIVKCYDESHNKIKIPNIPENLSLDERFLQIAGILMTHRSKKFYIYSHLSPGQQIIKIYQRLSDCKGLSIRVSIQFKSFTISPRFGYRNNRLSNDYSMSNNIEWT